MFSNVLLKLNPIGGKFGGNGGKVLLTDKQTKALSAGKHDDGRGLRLVKSAKDRGSWVLRFTLHGKRREMGLGSWPIISIKAARALAEEKRRLVARGIDPKAEREDAKRTFEQVACEAFEAKQAALKDDGKAGRWMSPLKVHLFPVIGFTPVVSLTSNDLYRALRPIWKEKPEASRKALQRAGIVLRHAKASGLAVDTQAATDARERLGEQGHKVTHIPAIPWQEVPDFYSKLVDGPVAAQALRLLILTAARSAPIRFCNISDIDGDVWTIPAERQKGRKGKTDDFRVPLSYEALAVIEKMEPFANSDGDIFTGPSGKVISDMSMAAVMKRAGLKERPHGFRSSFRDFSETKDLSWAATELCLSHAVGSKVERSYRRDDLLEKRKIILDRWAAHVCANHGKVIEIFK